MECLINQAPAVKLFTSAHPPQPCVSCAAVTRTKLYKTGHSVCEDCYLLGKDAVEAFVFLWLLEQS